ncbi:hypothetical protein SASPL_147887 [Salvia splendens]|uniref:Eukaryotic translation initiation factor 2A n=1 Tax=Salvia splendens TaxID=180675 RepID=A0A8X8Z6Y3_SALSN|nr:hypothetical protein SASPL_147887 [Salvia splendens]
MAVANPPSLDILVRDPGGFTIWSGPPVSNGEPQIKLDKIPCTSTKFSEDGSKLMAVRSDSLITIYDANNLAEIRAFQVPNLLAASISPCGTYLQTFQKSSTPQVKNVVLWKTETGESVYQVFQKNMAKATWPSIRFSSDEVVACRLATNEVQFFDAGDFSRGIVHRLKVQGIAAFELSKSPGSYVAVFVPESKGMPANVQIFSCAKESPSQPVARKSFFRCSSVQLHWNLGSKGLLVVVQSDVDKTNQSYYGETKLNYLTTDGIYEGLVSLRKEGPVHDVQWSSSGKEFAAVYGCILGFGNLPGDMAFWDYTEKKQLGATRAELSVSSEWSADGRYFMTATTAPRLQVDNGIKIFDHKGSLLFKRMYDKLFQVDWKPQSPDKFADIEEAVKSVGSLKLEDTTTKQGQGSKSAQPISKPSIPQKPAAYRPPSAKAAAAVQAELFGESPTGELSKNALKNKKKREKQREKKAAEASSGGT